MTSSLSKRSFPGRSSIHPSCKPVVDSANSKGTGAQFRLGQRGSSPLPDGALRKKAVNVFAANWLSMPLQFLAGVLVVRGAGASGKGVLTLIIATVALLGTAGQLSLPAAAIVFLRSGRASARTLLAIYMLVVVFVCVILAALGLIGFEAFRKLFVQDAPINNALLIVGLAAVPFFMMYTFVTTVLLAAGDAVTYSALVVGSAVFNVLSTFFAVIVYSGGVAGALIAATLTQVLGAIVACVVLLSMTRGEKVALSRQHAWEFIRFGLTQHPAAVGAQMFKRADSYLLAYFIGPAAVGYYSVASMAYDALLSIPRALSHLLTGEASELTSARSAVLISSASRNVTVIMFGFSVVVAIFAPLLVPLVFGADFIVSVAPLFVLLTAALFLGSAMCIQTYFLGRGRPDLISAIVLTGGVTNIVLSAILIPRAGLVGNAVATALGSAVVLLLYIISFRRATGGAAHRLFIPYKSDFTRLQSAVRFRKGRAPAPQENQG